jgi:uncharacterized membrane protein
VEVGDAEQVVAIYQVCSCVLIYVLVVVLPFFFSSERVFSSFASLTEHALVPPLCVFLSLSLSGFLAFWSRFSRLR